MIAAVRRWLGARELRRAERAAAARRRPSTVAKKGGQVLMGPQQPRPQVQTRIPGAPPRGLAAASTEVERAVRGYTHVLPLPESLAEELPKLTTAELGEHTRAVLAEHARRSGPAAWPRWTDTGE